MTILAVFTDCSEQGGVGQFSRQTAVALHCLAAHHGTESICLSLNDATGPRTIASGAAPSATIHGFARNKRSLVLSLLRYAPHADVLFLGHPNLAPLGPLARLRHHHLRYWVTAHGTEVWKRRALPDRWSLRGAESIAAVSTHTAAAVHRCQGVPQGQISVLPNSLDPSYADAPISSQPLAVPLGAPLLFSTARLRSHEPGKGVDSALRALPTVLNTFPDAHYAVAGDGDQRPYLEALAADLGVGEHVTFLGSIPDDLLRAYYRRCDVFVLPSRQEGFGIVFLEAMAFAKPVVAGNHGGTPDVVLDGKTGFLVDHDDAPAIADRVLRLLGDDALRRSFGIAGYRRLEEHFTFNHFQDCLGRLLGLPSALPVTAPAAGAHA